jgi:hypothetical protein
MSKIEQFVDRLPWPIKVLFILGGSLMSAFSSKFPDGLQSAGLYLGIAIVALALFALIWHSVKNSGRGKMIVGLAIVLCGCALGVLGLSIIAAGDRLPPPIPVKVADKSITSTSPQPPSSDSFASTYTISQPEIRSLRDEIFKIRGDLPNHIQIQTADDAGARRVAIALSKGIGLGGINVDGMSVGYPITPQETGISIRVADLGKMPASAIKLAEAIKKITGVEPRYTAMNGVATNTFVLFAGTDPKEN